MQNIRHSSADRKLEDARTGVKLLIGKRSQKITVDTVKAFWLPSTLTNVRAEHSQSPHAKYQHQPLFPPAFPGVTTPL